MSTSRTTTTALLLAVPALLLTAACSAGGGSAGGSSADTSSSARSSGSAGSTSSEKLVAPDAGGGTSATDGASGAKAAPAAVTPADRKIVATGQVSLRAKDLPEVRSRVMQLTTRWGGIVADEQTGSDDRGRIRSSTLTLRVPTPRFSEAMTALGELGEVQRTSRTTEDVTTQVIDNDARVRAAQRSIRQVERLLDRATQLSDIIAIESDLARRQADLDSLEQQQAWLADQTSLSTIDVHLARLTAAHAAPREAHGFLAGLADGWRALQRSTVVVLQVVGAVLPFGLLAGLVGVPLWLVARRRRPVAAPPAEA